MAASRRGVKAQEQPLDLRWGRYAAKMAAALVWLVTSVPAYSGMMDGDLPPAMRLVLMVVFCLPTLIWIVTVQRRMRMRDEFEVGLLTMGLARAAVFAMAWIALVLGSRVIFNILDPEQTPGTGLIAVVPPLVMAMAESFVQLERRRIAKS